MGPSRSSIIPCGTGTFLIYALRPSATSREIQARLPGGVGKNELYYGNHVDGLRKYITPYIKSEVVDPSSLIAFSTTLQGAIKSKDFSLLLRRRQHLCYEY
jgi:hypothetical protein